MRIVRSSNQGVKRKRGRINWEKVRATTDADIQRQIKEDGSDEAKFESGGIVVPPAYVRRVRERLGFTQAEFARRFGLRERTIQEWEQGRAQPEGPARVLLRIIEREPKAVERALKVS
jgi:putative transcriptional regulator